MKAVFFTAFSTCRRPAARKTFLHSNAGVPSKGPGSLGMG